VRTGQILEVYEVESQAGAVLATAALLPGMAGHLSQGGKFEIIQQPGVTALNGLPDNRLDQAFTLARSGSP
jgi:hypothetical protein